MVDLPAKHYQTILADPPWDFRSRSEKGMGRSAQNHYSVMTLDEIKALPVREVAAKNCVLFMWVTDTHLDQAFGVIEAWGFKFKTVGFYWAKTNGDGSRFTGMGFWTRANPEQCLLAVDHSGLPIDEERHQCLLATVGQPKRGARDVRRLIDAPRREHSRKPDEIYDRIEALVPGPYLELFSRADRPGWDSWGLEAGKFTAMKRRTYSNEDLL